MYKIPVCLSALSRTREDSATDLGKSRDSWSKTALRMQLWVQRLTHRARTFNFLQFGHLLDTHLALLVAQTVKNLLSMQETRIQYLIGKISWRRKWQPTPVRLPGKFHGQRSLVGYSPWGNRVRHDRVTITFIFWTHAHHRLQSPQLQLFCLPPQESSSSVSSGKGQRWPVGATPEQSLQNNLTEGVVGLSDQKPAQLDQQP